MTYKYMLLFKEPENTTKEKPLDESEIMTS